MLCDTDIMEQLSYAYIRAIVAHAGFVYEATDLDRDSIDATIKAPGLVVPTSSRRGAILELQIKAHCISMQAGTTFPYRVKIKNYNDLREDCIAPRLLIVFAMPEDKTQWLLHSTENLITRDCGYWMNLNGLPAVSNTADKTVRIPKCNHFSPESLMQIMTKISMKEPIGYGL